MRPGYTVIEYVEAEDDDFGAEDSAEVVYQAGRYFGRDRRGPWWDWDGNTKVIGPFYVNFQTFEKWRFPVTITWTVETEAPWRKGWGIGFSLGRKCVSVGIWKPRGPQRWLDASPEEISEWTLDLDA